MLATELAHFYKVCLFTNKVRVVGFANRVLRISLFRKYIEAWQRVPGFLTHPLSSTEALAQVKSPSSASWQTARSPQTISYRQPSDCLITYRSNFYIG
jgi:hypothetical protein